MPETCIIIPCYNEAHRLDVKSFADFLQNHFIISICFVDDGSTDGTISILEPLQNKFPAKVFIIKLPANIGKAEAVRRGVIEMYAQNRFEFLGFYDADLSAPLDSSLMFAGYLQNHPRCQVVFGSRMSSREASIKRNYLRHLGGRIFSFIINHYLGIKIYDTQCGAKLFRKEIVEAAFSEPFLSRWLFDIEIILRLRQSFNNGDSFVTEKPLPVWINKKGSKITTGDLLKLPREITAIKKKYKKSG